MYDIANKTIKEGLVNKQDWKSVYYVKYYQKQPPQVFSKKYSLKFSKSCF